MCYLLTCYRWKRGSEAALLLSAKYRTVLACNGVRIVSANPCNDIKYRIEDGF